MSMATLCNVIYQSNYISLADIEITIPPVFRCIRMLRWHDITSAMSKYVFRLI